MLLRAAVIDARVDGGRSQLVTVCWLLQAVTALQARSRELAALVALARIDGDPAHLQQRIRHWVESAASGLQ